MQTGSMQEELVSVNAELRYITVELMKIASQRNISFDKIAKEYVSNVYHLDIAIRNGKAVEEGKPAKFAAKGR